MKKVEKNIRNEILVPNFTMDREITKRKFDEQKENKKRAHSSFDFWKNILPTYVGRYLQLVTIKVQIIVFYVVTSRYK